MIKIKKGVYFATMSILMVFFMIVSYGFIERNQKEKAAIGNLGKYSGEMLRGNLEGERLRFFVDESFSLSKNIAFKKVKENVGVYDFGFSGCVKVHNYVVIDDQCNQDWNLAFVGYFNDTFGNFLKLYNEEYKAEDFEINFDNGVLSINGVEKIPLNVRTKREKEVLRHKENKESIYDDVLSSNNILDFIREYSEIYSVDENLVKAVIMKESKGRIDAVNSNPDSTDYGLMQINDKAHPEFFNENVEGFICNAADSVECNIKAGVTILNGYYDQYKEGKTFSCTGRFYGGWEAALRAYNGWGCTGNNNYVEDVLALYGGEIEFELEGVTELEEKGFLTVDMSFVEDIGYDFSKFDELLARARNIKDCVLNGDNSDICSVRESGLDYVFNANHEANLIKFDIEEIDSGDIIKFALHTETQVTALKF